MSTNTAIHESTDPNTAIHNSIDKAAETVGRVWPLHSFVTANPLAGFEDQPFHEAVQQAEDIFGGQGYPSADLFRQAWETGQIDSEVLSTELDEHGYSQDPDALLDQLATDGETPPADEKATENDTLDQLLTKWLAAFLDQGQADWPMPNRQQGFYAAFCDVARYDNEIPNRDAIGALPETPIEAIKQSIPEYTDDQLVRLFEQQLTALPGWTGLIKHRAAEDTDWQSTYPISLVEYLAVRLTLADLLDAPIEPRDATGDTATADSGESDETVPLKEVWLTAWEATYRRELVEAVSEASESTAESADNERPDAQFVFCIDTRSEIVRRHIEAVGAYETHGYAGFFGIPMRYKGYNSDVTVDACPPIVDAQHRITDRPSRTKTTTHDEHDRWAGMLAAGHKVVKALRSNSATAFSFVESAGAGYGVGLAAKTLLPTRLASAIDAVDHTHDDHEFCEPSIDYNPDALGTLREGLTLDEKVEYASTAFELMGWEAFARIVVFAGHASQTANNPFGSSLDCGACAGNPGGPSARVLASICNDQEVIDSLRDRGFDIPADTVFVAGEHNTTTDEITLYDEDVPESHAADLEELRGDLETARTGAATERAASMETEGSAGVDETERRAADWSETRPEWGLAGNAAFVIGSQELTADIDLGGRSFLHSYNWTTDPDGDALATIMSGPMVVTQWINMQYYFATVDTAVYGSGSKVTHNPVGNVGVYQGNGGDLLTGLPLQSLMAADDDPHHQPLRLSTVIHAPVERVTAVLTTHDQLTELLDNGWLSLTVVDPTQDHSAFHYDGELNWTTVRSQEPLQEETPMVETPVVAGD
jgi:hypothetical protein